MRIRILAFATAAEALGGREHDLELPDGGTVGDLLERLAGQAPELAELSSRLALAIDGELVGPEAALTDGCELALLPPVSGGGPRLVREPIDPASIFQPNPACGAEVVFLGRVRDHSSGRAVVRITYDGYEAMADHGLDRIARELTRDGVEVEIVHRLGEVEVGEASVAIAARSAHREEAFAACRRALERIKSEVPIWKLEHYADGSAAWREEERLGPTRPPEL